MQTDCLFWYFRLGLCYTAKNHKRSDCTRDLVGTQATRTNINRFRRAVHNRFNPTNIGFPSTVGFSVGMGHVIAENNAFSAYTAFCHGGHLLLSISHHSSCDYHRSNLDFVSFPHTSHTRCTVRLHWKWKMFSPGKTAKVRGDSACILYATHVIV